MGLDTSHNAWHGAYSAFMRWRTEIARAAGICYIDEKEGRYQMPWHVYEDKNYYGEWDHDPSDPLVVLLVHSDCEGEIPPRLCGPLADRLESLLPQLSMDAGGHVGIVREKTETFIAGLRAAAAANEPLDFH